MPAQSIALDARAIPPRDKHHSTFRAFDGLQSGQTLTLVNGHDPRPLRYQLMAVRPDTVDWEYEEQGPQVWRVNIRRK
jgi:uncharacterized protein (DUF2249 family)